MNAITRFHHFILACNRMMERIKVFLNTHKGAVTLSLMGAVFTGWLVYCEMKDENDNDYLQTIIMSITAVIALLTLDSMRRSNNAQTIREYDSQYADRKMLVALKKVHDFMKEHKDNFKNSRKTDKEPSIEDGDFALEKAIRKEIDNERRIVKFYFINILCMYKEGNISYRSMHHLFDKSGFAIFFEGIERMENIINKNYDRDPFEKAMLLCYDLYEKHREKNEGLK